MHMYFFFSSRRRHTRLQGDWSSDVCSSDLQPVAKGPASVRVLWASRNNPVPVPIPASVLSHSPGEELARSQSAHNGEIGRASCRERVKSASGAAQVDRNIRASTHKKH